MSQDDDLLTKYAELHPHLHAGEDLDTLQRLVEGRHLDARMFLQKYETPVEGQRNIIHTHRQQVLDGTIPCASEQARLVTLRTIDDVWADYLERLAEFRGALPWIEWASPTMFGNQMGKLNAYQEYAQKIHEWFRELQANLPEEIERRIAEAERLGTVESGDRGAVWTYLTTDQPFGSFTERLVRGLKRRSN
jgi:preprotein translocase subunit SecA